MKISTHLDHKPFQVAITSDPKLPVRKWDHRGTIHAVSSLDAAFRFMASKGNMSNPKDHPPVDSESIVYAFGDTYIRVH